VHEAVYPSSSYGSLEEIIDTFLTRYPADLQGASFGVAGPVVDNQAQITNLTWVIDGRAISQAIGVSVHLLNDLEAIANAVPHLLPDEITALNVGVPEEHGAIGVIAPGTGLGEAFLVWTGTRYESYPSEGGHTAFAPTSERQLDMLAYWQKELGHVSYERLCSGMGIPNLYRYLRDCGDYEELPKLRAKLASAPDKTPLIIQSAVSGECPICSATLELFMEILGDEDGNLALKVLATGGIYIGGGIPPRILPELQSSRFMTLFTRKGRFSDLMSRIPVNVIRNPKVALHGAAYEAIIARDE
jgi:glucokinase